MMQHDTAGARAHGSMTTIMRAVRPGGQRALRVGLVRAGRVIEERVIKTGHQVTAGRDESCDLILAGQAAPARAVLFERDGKGGYTLRVPEGMTGRIAVQDAVTEIASPGRVMLDQSARGKLSIGEDTILFGFIDVPPAQAHPQLPISVRSGAAESIDWSFTVLAAFSFLLHFGAVGALYSDWMDPYVGDEVAIAGLVESMQQLPSQPYREQAEEADPSSEARATQPADGQRAGARSTNGRGGKSPGAGAEGGGAPSDNTQLKGLSEELDRINIATLSAMNDRGSGTAEVLSEGGLPTGPLEDLARNPGGVAETNEHGLHMSGTSTTVGLPGADRGNRLADLGNKKSEGPSDVGKKAEVAGPKPIVGVSPPQVAGGEIPGAEGVVAGMQSAFRRCYERGLLVNPEMSGSVRVAAQVGPNGEVLNVSASPAGTISSSVAQCIAGRVRGAQFERPKNGAATLIIPVSLLQQVQR